MSHPDDPSKPFDHLEEPSGSRPRLAEAVALLLRAFSALTLLLAFCSAAFLLALDIPGAKESIIRRYPALVPWAFRSAWPLILIGLSYASLLFAVPRRPLQRLLGLLVSAGFIIWGSEQFVRNPAVAAFMDDLVVFLFVLDLSLLIREHLAKSPRKPPW